MDYSSHVQVTEEMGVASQMESASAKSSDDDVIQIDWGDLSHPTSTDTVSGQEEVVGNGVETIDWDGIKALDLSGIVTVEEDGQAQDPSQQGGGDSSPSQQGGGDSSVYA